MSDYVKATSLAKVAGTGAYGDLTGKPVLAKLGASCGTNLLLKGLKEDGSYECVSAGISGDLLNEVSNDLIWNQFIDSKAGTKDVQIKDGFAAGVTDTLTFPDVGLAQKVWVDFSAGNSDLSQLVVELYAPGMTTPYLLYNGGKTGTQLVAAYNDADKLLSGDLDKDWLGKNIKGNWSLTVRDKQAISLPPGTPPFVYDGKFNWTLNVQTLSSKKVQIKGNLLVDQAVTASGDVDVAGALRVGGQPVLSNFKYVLINNDFRNNAGTVAEAAAVDFPEVTDTPIRPADWGRLHFDRRTERYREAIGLARMILLDERPDLRWGDREVVALLFDMNALFEAYLEAAVRGLPGVRVQSQSPKRFWQPPGEGARMLKPDLIVHVEGQEQPVVVDAKWKVPDRGRPVDDDLRQVFAYLHGFEAERGVLVYPRANEAQYCQEALFLDDGLRGRVGFLDLFLAGQPDLHALRAGLPAVLGLVEAPTSLSA